MIDLIKSHISQGIAVVLLVLLGVQSWRLHDTQLELAETKIKLSSEQAKAAKALAMTEKAHRAVEQSLQDTAAQTRKEANHAVSVAVTERDSLLKRLRDAEAKLAQHRRVSEASPASIAGSGIKRDAGTELPATLGEEDVEEAYRADILRIELLSCYEHYERARQALKELDK